MTKEEFTLEKIQIDKEREMKYKVLCVCYAKENNPYQIGDIIKDHIGSIKIEKISTIMYNGNSLPCCGYIGVELKKDLTPRKDLNKRVVHQDNIII